MVLDVVARIGLLIYMKMLPVQLSCHDGCIAMRRKTSVGSEALRIRFEQTRPMARPDFVRAELRERA